MKVKLNQLVEGCILAKDVYGKTNQPLFRSKTILTNESIEVLQAFLIDCVDVEGTLVNGQTFKVQTPNEKKSQLTEKTNIEKSFIDIFLQAVQQYKKLFKSWQAGSKVDILSVRKMLLPLIEKLDEKPSEILLLHHFSTKEEYLYFHSVSVGLLSAYLGKRMGYKKSDEIQLAIAGTLADSGMSKLPNKILENKGVLNSFEYGEVKQHPMYSYQMLKDIPAITEAALISVLQHHEREDGSGYPLGLNMKKLHPFSRIIAVSDVFHAMASERFYKSKQSPYRVIETIMQDSFGKFEHQVVQTLVNSIINFSIGQKVRLNNGDQGEIIFLEPNAPTRPMIKIDESGGFVKLINSTELFIEEVFE